MFGVAFDRNNVNRLGLVGMDIARETEIGWQIPAYFVPQIARVITAHDIPMFLHEKDARTRPMHRYAMHTMPDLSSRVRNLFRTQSPIDWPPCLTAVIRPEGACRRYRDENPLS